MRQKKLYMFSRQMKRINAADQELWMRSYVVYPLIIFLSLMDAATLYDIFFRMSNVDEWILYLLTFGVAVVLNFIPLVLGR